MLGLGHKMQCLTYSAISMCLSFVLLQSGEDLAEAYTAAVDQLKHMGLPWAVFNPFTD